MQGKTGGSRLSTDDTKKGALGALAALAGTLPRSESPGLGLSSLWTRPEVRGLYYNGQVLRLDGYKFVGCRFDNCVLHVSSDNFELIQCVIDSTTRIEYSAKVSKLIKLFVGRYHWASQVFPAFFLPTKNSDGSETISDRGY